MRELTDLEMGSVAGASEDTEDRADRFCSKNPNGEYFDQGASYSASVTIHPSDWFRVRQREIRWPRRLREVRRGAPRTPRGTRRRRTRTRAESARSFRTKILTKQFVQLLLVAGIGGCAGASETSPPTSGELLERVITETQLGNFESAWNAYEAFFAHPRRNSVPVDTFGRCFYWYRCPGVGLLGALLDKTPQDAAGFWSFCPDWSSTYVDQTPGKLEAFRRRMDGFVAAAARYDLFGVGTA